MNFVFSIIIFLIIGIVGFCFVNKLGEILDENSDSIESTNRTNLIHLGFNEPYLVEDFICKVEENNKKSHSMELIIYSGTKDDIMSMLLAGKLDYAILSNTIKDLDMNNITYKEILLKPKKLRTDMSDISIEIANNASKKVVAFWIPRWINKEKEYFSELIMNLE